MKNTGKYLFAIAWLALCITACTQSSSTRNQGDSTVSDPQVVDSAIEGNAADTTVSGMQNNKDMSTGTDGLKDSAH